MPLTFAKNGDIKTIKKIIGKDELCKHLAKLGFVVGEQVMVVNDAGGDLILSVKGTRIALGKTTANKILV